MVVERVRTSVLALFLVGMSLPCVANQHYIRVNADFSYARDCAPKEIGPVFIEQISLLDAQEWIGAGRAESLTASNGFAPGVGVGYRFKHNLLLVDLGLGAEYRCLYNQPYDVNEVRAAAVDDTGLGYIGYHTWNSREARMQHIGMSMPVMIGVEWKSLYVLAGVRANMDIWGRSRETGAYTLKADYDYFMNTLVNVAGHGYVEDEPYTAPETTVAFGWEIRACAEVGYCISTHMEGRRYQRKQQPRYYVGAFAEYGFAGSRETYRSLLAGVRFTAMLPLPEKQVCKCLGY